MLGEGGWAQGVRHAHAKNKTPAGVEASDWGRRSFAV
jgi:hypothetical protein